MVPDMVSLRLTQEQALVLFDWLARSSEAGPASFAHQAEQRVLWDLEAELEKVTIAPLSSDYAARLHSARDAVADRTTGAP